MNDPVLLILSVGELGSSILEAAARSGLFGRIVIAGRSARKAQERANGALIGAALEGRFPEIRAEKIDVDSPGFARKLRSVRPDVIVTTASLMPWWQIDKSTAPKLPFGGYVSLHLAVMKTFRDRLAEADTGAIWIGASYPDVVNPVLHRSGYGPLCGIGNIQEPVPKIRLGLSRRLAVPVSDISVRLVAQHAFEYHVFSDPAPRDLPPYLLHAEVGGRDVSAVAHEVLRAPFPFRFDLFFNRVTASAAVEAMAGLLSPNPTAAHLPGVNGLVGGYPVMLQNGVATLDLHPSWTREDAIDTNLRSLPWEGIETIEADGTIWFTDAAQAAFRDLLGKPVARMTMAEAEHGAREILAAL